MDKSENVLLSDDEIMKSVRFCFNQTENPTRMDVEASMRDMLRKAVKPFKAAQQLVVSTERFLDHPDTAFFKTGPKGNLALQLQLTLLVIRDFAREFILISKDISEEQIEQEFADIQIMKSVRKLLEYGFKVEFSSHSFMVRTKSGTGRDYPITPEGASKALEEYEKQLSRG